MSCSLSVEDPQWLRSLILSASHVVPSSWYGLIGIALLVVLFILSPFGTIAAGERGIHLRFNALTGKVFGEGLYFKVPFIESVQMLDVKIQKVETSQLLLPRIFKRCIRPWP
jgi:regulator of protease activity HflC (stomatin/prohibitin superfamily)